MRNVARVLKISFRVLVLLLVGASVAAAESFPFRSVAVGEPLPAITLTESGAGQPYAVPRGGKGAMVMAFWSADVATKKERSIKALKVLQEMRQYFQERNISLLVVNEGRDSPEIIAAALKEAGLVTPVYLDNDQSVYGTLGLYVMPSLLLVDATGKIAAGMGYSHDLDKRLHGELAVLLGEMDRAKLEEVLHPKNIEKSEKEKTAGRHFNLGKTMRQRGQPESAIKEFSKALEVDPEMGEASIQLGCLQVEVEQYEAAGKSLADGLAREPGSVEGQICQAQVKAAAGGLDEALDDLRFLMLRNSRVANLHYALASVLLKKGNCAEAAPEFRAAYDLLLKKENLE